MAEFCNMPIIIRDDMPVGVMVVMSGDGKQIVPIVNLDIEVCGTLPPRPFEIEYGKQEVTGTFTAEFTDPDLYARFTSNTGSVARYTMEAIIRLGDQLAAKDQLNRHARKDWRAKRRRMAAFVRREDAREERNANGLATF